MRAHRNGQHEFCDPERCTARRKLADLAQKCREARDILDQFEDWTVFGRALPELRSAARWPLEKYPTLGEEFNSTVLSQMQARYIAEQIIKHEA
jgi:hypothetical protein